MARVNAQPHPLLRRPFSIHAREEEKIEIFFKIAGLGTSLLSKKKQGESLDILGPLGNGFSYEDDMKGKSVLCVGGGRGIAPLYFLAQELKIRGALVKILYGGKTHADLPLLSKFQDGGVDISWSTDDGSSGFEGLVTGLYEKELSLRIPAHVFACGPDAMMKRVAEIAQKMDIPVQLSLESLMGCGFGVCWGCVKRIKRGSREEWMKICEEGPVFRPQEIVWPEEEGEG